MPTLKKAAPAPVAFPSIETHEYARLGARDRDLRLRLGEVITELNDLSHRSALKTAPTRIDALVSGETLTAANDSVQDRSALLRQEKADLLAAIETIRGRLADERRKASEAAWVHLAPLHAEKVKAVAIALAGALSAHRELERLSAQINDSDISWAGHNRFSAAQILGGFHDDQSSVRQLLSEAVREGFATAADVSVA